MSIKIDSHWDELTGFSEVIISDSNGHDFQGTAYVHPDDRDMANELTGKDIAFTRAEIKLITNEMEKIRNQIKELNHLMSLYIQNPKVKHEDECFKILLREIENLNDYHEALKTERAGYRKSLHECLQRKDEFYKKIRKVRAEKSQAAEG